MDAETYQKAGIFVGGVLVTLFSGWKVKRSQDDRISQLEAKVKAAIVRLEEMPDRQDQLEHRQNMTNSAVNNLQVDVEQDRGEIQRAIRTFRDKLNDMVAVVVRLEEQLARAVQHRS